MLHSENEFYFIVVSKKDQYLLVTPTGWRTYVSNIFDATKFREYEDADEKTDYGDIICRFEFKAINLSFDEVMNDKKKRL